MLTQVKGLKIILTVLLAASVLLALTAVSADALPMLSLPSSVAPVPTPNINGTDNALPQIVNPPAEPTKAPAPHVDVHIEIPVVIHPAGTLDQKDQVKPVDTPPKPQGDAAQNNTADVTKDDTQKDTPDPVEPAAVTYIIRFVNDAGSVIYSAEVKQGRSLSAAPDTGIEKEGFTLAGWLIRVLVDEEIKLEPYTFGSAVHSDITLFPNWKMKAALLSGEELPDEETDDTDTGHAAVNTAEPSAAAEPVKKSVALATTAFGEVTPGDIITLYAIIKGYDDIPYTLAWQYENGSGWKTAQTGGSTFSFILTEDNYHWNWRLELTADSV